VGGVVMRKIMLILLILISGCTTEGNQEVRYEFVKEIETSDGRVFQLEKKIYPKGTFRKDIGATELLVDDMYDLKEFAVYKDLLDHFVNYNGERYSGLDLLFDELTPEQFFLLGYEKEVFAEYEWIYDRTHLNNDYLVIIKKNFIEYVPEETVDEVETFVGTITVYNLELYHFELNGNEISLEELLTRNELTGENYNNILTSLGEDAEWVLAIALY